MPVLDGIRGLAALAVVFFHLQGTFARVSFPHSYLAVDLFFAMSALVLWSSYGTRLTAGMRVSEFAAIRLIRLYPLYLLGTALGIAIVCLSRMPTPGEVLLSLLMLPDLGSPTPFAFDGPAWSLFFEMVGGLGLVMLATRFTTARLLAAAACGLAAAIALAMLRPEHDMNMGFTSRNMIGGSARALADFAIGLLLARTLLPRIESWTRRPPVRPRHGAIRSWLPILLTVAMLGFPWQGRLALPYDVAIVALACPVILLLAATARPGPRLSAAFKLAGVVSFPLYALHDPIRNGVAALVARTGGGHAASATIVATLAVCLLVALAADRWFDRPVRRRLSDWRGRHRAPTPHTANAAAA